MKIIEKEIKVKKSLNNADIEKELSQFGEPLRWAVVDIIDNAFLIDAVFVEN